LLFHSTLQMHSISFELFTTINLQHQAVTLPPATSPSTMS
jgi:hypothetical protein